MMNWDRDQLPPLYFICFWRPRYLRLGRLGIVSMRAAGFSDSVKKVRSVWELDKVHVNSSHIHSLVWNAMAGQVEKSPCFQGFDYSLTSLAKINLLLHSQNGIQMLWKLRHRSSCPLKWWPCSACYCVCLSICPLIVSTFW